MPILCCSVGCEGGCYGVKAEGTVVCVGTV